MPQTHVNTLVLVQRLMVLLCVNVLSASLVDTVKYVSIRFYFFVPS